MRVTENLMFTSAARHSMAARARHQQAADVMATGKRVTHPWEDPAAAALVARHRASENTWKAVGEVAGRASDELGAADAALDDLHVIFVRARELAVQLANGSYSAADRSAGGAEVRQFHDQVRAELNRDMGGRYLFGGSKDNAPPFDAAGAYVGDNVIRQAELAPGMRITANVHADTVANGGFDGADLLLQLDTLATAMSTNDIAGIQASLTGLEQATGRLSVARAGLGSDQNLLDAAVVLARSVEDGEKIQSANLAEADVIDAATRLAQAQQALEAAVTASAKSYATSILDMLK